VPTITLEVVPSDWRVMTVTLEELPSGSSGITKVCGGSATDGCVTDGVVTAGLVASSTTTAAVAARHVTTMPSSRETAVLGVTVIRVLVA
jgi:hypothetical protein